MLWVLLWTGLLLAAGLLLGLIGRDLWRKAKALTAELTRTTDRLSAVSASLSQIADQQADRAAGLNRRTGPDEEHASTGHARGARSSPRQ
jgi:hypothetical protein